VPITQKFVAKRPYYYLVTFATFATPKKLATPSISHAYCITDFSCDETRWIKAREACRYIIFGRETCPSTGRKHLQGYVYLTRKGRSSAVRKLFPGANVLVANGSPQDNRTYCSKDGNFVEWGVIPVQGRRTDMETLVDNIKSGASIAEIADAQPGMAIRYLGNIQKLRLHYLPVRRTKTHVTWLYGPTGTGKSHRAHLEAGADAYHKSSGKWWSGYDGQLHVVLDDFRKGWFPFADLLRLLDKYPYQVEIKGGEVQFLAERIWITCHKSPQELYGVVSFNGEDHEREDLGQLLRRVDVLIHMDVPYAGPDDSVVQQSVCPGTDSQEGIYP